mgnify:CR=1 FL=1
MKTYTKPTITNSAHMAENTNELLAINDKILVEINQSTDDGVFEDQDEWDQYEDSIIENGIPESVIQYWELELRKPLFKWVTRIGLDRYIGVSADALEFEFSHELFVYSDSVCIEYYVKASFKES